MKDLRCEIKYLNDENFQKYLIVTIVCSVLFLDNVLGLVLVPLIPSYLKDFDLEDGALLSPPNSSVGPGFDGFNRSLTSKADVSNLPERLHTPKVGIVFASKPLLQLLTAPIAGSVIDRFDYEKPMYIGLMTIFISTVILAFSHKFLILAAARGFQGIGSALCDMAGFSILAERFSEQNERSKYQGLAVAFISFGSYVGPPFGGLSHHYIGRQAPFLILSAMVMIDFLLTILVKNTELKRRYTSLENLDQSTKPFRLLLDPYVMICFGALFLSGVVFAALEATIAQWMEETMDANEFQIGIVWLPSFAFHILGVVFVLYLMKRFAKYHWLFIMLGLVIVSTSSFLVSLCQNYLVVLAPLSAGALGLALIDTVVLPLMGRLVDVRHSAAYGSVYALAEVAFALSYICGPLLGDILYQSVGFWWLNLIICFLGILYSTLMFAMKDALEYEPSNSPT